MFGEVFKRGFPCFIGVLALGAVVATPALARSCATPSEMAAIQLRSLQTDLMVRALSCQQKASYNNFMARFKGVLQTHAGDLKGYFNRVYAANGTPELNAFLTDLSNMYAAKSMNATDAGFCEHSKGLFATMLAVKSDALVQTALNYKSPHSIHACSATQMVQRDQQTNNKAR